MWNLKHELIYTGRQRLSLRERELLRFKSHWAGSSRQNTEKRPRSDLIKIQRVYCSIAGTIFTVNIDTNNTDITWICTTINYQNNTSNYENLFLPRFISICNLHIKDLRPSLWDSSIQNDPYIVLFVLDWSWLILDWSICVRPDISKHFYTVFSVIIMSNVKHFLELGSKHTLQKHFHPKGVDFFSIIWLCFDILKKKAYN